MTAPVSHFQKTAPSAAPAPQAARQAEHSPASPGAPHPTAGKPHELSLRNLLEEMIERGASDLHVVCNTRPKLRINGDITDSRYPLPLKPASMDEWRSIALAHNPQLLSARLGVENARLEIQRNKAGHAPRVDFIAAYSKDDSASLQTYQQNSVNRTIGVQVNIPIYQGGAISAQTRQAADNWNRAQSDLDNRTNQVLVELRKAYDLVQNSVAKVTALEKAVASGKELMVATEQSIKGGVRINLDLLNAQQQLYSSQRDLAQARYSYLLGLLRLRAAAGTLGDSDVREVAAYFR
jgi:protease secretion system outer membrane protein